jgi:hypothetical protein
MVAIATSGVATAMPTSRSVSRLARDARRMIDGAVGSMDAVELLLRIDAMRDDLQSTPDAPLCTWLENLRLKVERSA